MDNHEIVLHPQTNKERKIAIDWPKKEDLVRDRDKYLDSNIGSTSSLIGIEYPGMPPEQLGIIARLYLESVFSIETMQKISPLPLEVPIRVQPEFGPVLSDSLLTQEVLEHGQNGKLGELKEIVVKVFIDAIRMETETLDSDARSFYYEYIIDTSRGVEEATLKFKQGKIEELDVAYLSAGPHEWEHILYLQETYLRKKQGKLKGLANNYALRLSAIQNKMSTEEYLPKYYALDPEFRGRIWERKFLKNYYPDSKKLKEVELEIQSGRDSKSRAVK